MLRSCVGLVVCRGPRQALGVCLLLGSWCGCGLTWGCGLLVLSLCTPLSNSPLIGNVLRCRQPYVIVTCLVDTCCGYVISKYLKCIFLGLYVCALPGFLLFLCVKFIGGRATCKCNFLCVITITFKC